MLNRGEPERELDLERVQSQLMDCAMHHTRFMQQGKLTHSQQLDLEKLSELYLDYRRETKLDEIEPAGRRIFAIDQSEWRSKTPLQRYVTLHSQRAGEMERMLEMILKNAGPSSREPRFGLDVGAGSCFFIEHMTQKGNQMWFGVNIEGSKSPITQDQFCDRDLLGTFKEFKAGDPLPFFGDPTRPKDYIPPPGQRLKFDIATLFYVLHHVPEEQVDALLKQTYDQLEPGGKIVVVEDNVGEFQVIPERMAFVKAMDDFFYPDFPGNQQPTVYWIDKLEKAGFRFRNAGDLAVFNSAGIRTYDNFIVMEKPA